MLAVSLHVNLRGWMCLYLHTCCTQNAPSLPTSFQAVSENLALKQGIFRSLSEELSPKTILATNTSSISITKIAASTIPQGKTAADPEGKESTSRVVGLHFFNPVPVMVRVPCCSIGSSRRLIWTTPPETRGAHCCSPNFSRHP